jgi:hypothetical protein
VSLATCLAAYEQWLLDEEADLLELLDDAFTSLEGMFGAEEQVLDAGAAD